LEAEGPMLKLGGTWQFPQQADSISLSSHSSDEGTNFTDTDSASALSGSAISSPLQVCHVIILPCLSVVTRAFLLYMKQHAVESGLMLSTGVCLLENFLGPDYMG
jgi:hypothetical protein